MPTAHIRGDRCAGLPPPPPPPDTLFEDVALSAAAVLAFTLLVGFAMLLKRKASKMMWSQNSFGAKLVVEPVTADVGALIDPLLEGGGGGGQRTAECRVPK